MPQRECYKAPFVQGAPVQIDTEPMGNQLKAKNIIQESREMLGTPNNGTPIPILLP